MIYYLGLGSNIGHLEQNLFKTLSKIAKINHSFLLSQSGFYRTKAWGFPDQADFLNVVAKVESGYFPNDFLHILQEIETELGKVRLFKWGPRIIDIDILFCDDIIHESSELSIPHPFAHARYFVLKPMCDLEPDLVHPVLKKTMKELLVELKKP